MCHLRRSVPAINVKRDLTVGRNTVSRTLGSPIHLALADLIRSRRKEARLTQVEVARRLDRPQSFLTSIERGERRLDVAELLNIAEAVGFDVHALIDEIKEIRCSLSKGHQPTVP